MPIVKKTLDIPPLTLEDGAIIRFKHITTKQKSDLYDSKGGGELIVNIARYFVDDFSGFTEEGGEEIKCDKLRVLDKGYELTERPLKALISCGQLTDDGLLVKIYKHYLEFEELSEIDKKKF